MQKITIDSGRFFRRYVNDGNILVGCVFIDSSIQLKEGHPYLLYCDEQQCLLFSDSQSNMLNKLTLEQKNYGIDGMLTSPMWPGTTDPRYRVVHVIKQFEKENGWLVFGPSKDIASMGQWFTVKNSVCIEDTETYDTMGETICGIVRKPLWPHPDGHRYALVPNFKEIAQSYQELHQLYVASSPNKKALEQLWKHHHNIFAYVFDANGRSLPNDFVSYLIEINKTESLDIEKPTRAVVFNQKKLNNADCLSVDEKSIDEMLNNPASSKEATVALIASHYLSHQTTLDQTQAWSTVNGNDWLFVLGSLRPNVMDNKKPINPMYQKVFEQWIPLWESHQQSETSETQEMIDRVLSLIIKDCGEQADKGFAQILLNTCQTNELKKMLLGEIAAGKSFEMLENYSEMLDDVIVQTMCATALTTYGFAKSIPLIDRWKHLSTKELDFQNILQQCNVPTPAPVDEMRKFIRHFSLEEDMQVPYDFRKEFYEACALNKVLQEKERLGKVVENFRHKNAVKRKM